MGHVELLHVSGAGRKTKHLHNLGNLVILDLRVFIKPKL